MKKLKTIPYVFLITLIMVNITSLKSFADESWIGIMDNEAYTLETYSVRFPAERAFDNNSSISWDYSSLLNSGGYIKINFENLQDIKSIKYKKGYSTSFRIYFYNENGDLIKNYNCLYKDEVYLVDLNVEGVKSIKIQRTSSRGGGGFYELEFYPMLPKMGDLVVGHTKTIKKINLTWNDLDADKYYVYLNNELIRTFDSSVTNYTIEDLTSNQTYDVRVEASKEGYRNAKFQESITTLNYFSFSPTNPNSNVGDTWIKVNWKDVNEATGYQIQIDDNEIINVDGTSYRFDNLLAGTEYLVKIRSVFEGNLYSDWTVINTKTLNPPEVPPYKSDRLDIIETGTDFIVVQVSKTLYADSYIFYIDNKKIQETAERTFTFTGLEENTSYTLSCRSKNEYGESRFPVARLVKTLGILKPKVTNVKSGNAGYSASGGLNKKVTWESENVKEGYELYIDGTLVGEYDLNTKEAIIDYEELGLDDGFHDIEIKPKDPEGIGYKFRLTNQGTGNEDLDRLVGYQDKALQIIKRGGIYLLIAIISFAIGLLGARFLFNKWKLGLVTATPEQIEADPDQAMKVDKQDRHVFDKQAKQIADNVENRYYDRKKNEKEKKKITNKVPAYRMKDKNTMILSTSTSAKKRVELDDLDNYLKYARMSKYDKQLVRNAVEDWKRRSNTRKFFHLSSNSKELSLGGYVMKDKERGDKNRKMNEEETIRHYEEKIYSMIKDNKTT